MREFSQRIVISEPSDLWLINSIGDAASITSVASKKFPDFTKVAPLFQ